MKFITWQMVISLVIAAFTTITTTAFTNYLLARPWCIQIESDDHQRILYGSSNCSSEDITLRNRQALKESAIAGKRYFRYQ